MSIINQIYCNIEQLIGLDRFGESLELLNQIPRNARVLNRHNLLVSICKHDGMLEEYIDNLDQDWKSDASLYYPMLLATLMLDDHNKFIQVYVYMSILETHSNRLADFDKYIEDYLTKLIAHTPRRVFQGTINIANQMSILTKAMRKSGVLIKSYSLEEKNYLGYKVDEQLDFSKIENVTTRTFAVLDFIANIILEYDVFNFHFGISILSSNKDMALIKKFGKKIVMHHWGSDVRRFSLSQKVSPYNTSKISEHEAVLQLEKISPYVDLCIVPDNELKLYVESYYKHVEIIPILIELDEQQDNLAYNINYSNELKVVHAPTSPEVKGTKYIIEAIEKLKKEGFDIDFILVQGMSNEDAKKIYKIADLIIDQILIGQYGLFALEAMSYGKPVIAYISDYLKPYYDEGMPIISATPDTIYAVIKDLFLNRALLEKVAPLGPIYVKRVHDVNRHINRYINIYNTI